VDVNAALIDAGAKPLTPESDDVWEFLFSDRGGWLWLEKTAADPIAHLSLLLADGDEVGDQIRDLLERVPPPAFCELDHFVEDDGEYVRVVARFPVVQGSEAISRYLHRLAAIADLVTESLAGRDLRKGADALVDLWATLGDAGVAPPPVPPQCREQLTVLGPWWWGSALMHPIAMYMFDASEDLLGSWDRGPLFALSHAGHGINSYGLSLAVASGPVAAFVQHSFGGGYADPVRDLDDIAMTYGRLHQVIAATQADAGTPARWLLLMSNYRMVYQLVDLERRRREGTEDAGENPYRTLEFGDEHDLWRALIERLPYAFGAGVAIDW
jgi:hypothetical protein